MTHPFSRLLLATEHGEFDTGAEALAFALSRRCALPLAGVLPVVSNPEFEAVAPQLAAKADAEAGARREQLAARARAEGVTLDLRVRHGAEPFAEIVDEARARAADLIVIRRRGKRSLLANLLVGEMVSKVVSHAPCSLLITPRAARMWEREVMLGLDPQAPDTGALALAAGVAAECGMPLHVLCVAGGDAGRAEAERAVAAAVASAAALGCRAQGLIRIGRPHQELLAAASAVGADLIVVGRHGIDRRARAWFGGVAQKVIGLAECPVLVYVPRIETSAT